MQKVRTKEQLVKAVILRSPVIHVEDKHLALALMSKDRRFRFVHRIAIGQGYMMRAVRCLGEFEVKFYKC